MRPNDVRQPFTDFAVANGFINDMHLVDVGASGGIDPIWSAFGEKLSAVGFDPLVMECERLNQLNQGKKQSFIPAFVGAPTEMEFPDRYRHDQPPYTRTSTQLAVQRMNINPRERYNDFQEIIHAADHITLDDYFSGVQEKLDFLKIDTDGHDIEVLHGATRLLDENNFLGICVESQFHGPVHPLSNTFSNIDNFLRERGFRLFDMEFHRYSRKELPGKFLISIPAQTDIGQIQWADVLYFRDFADKYIAIDMESELSHVNIIKLACLYEIHNLHDCAIELLTVHKERLGKIIDIVPAIELLVPPIDGNRKSMRDYQLRFDQSIEEMRFLNEGNIKYYDEKKKDELKQYNKVLFFGAGGRLIEAYPIIERYLDKKISIKVADNDKKKWGQTIFGKEIISPEQIPVYNPEIVIIVSTFKREILSQIIQIQEKSSLKLRIACF